MLPSDLDGATITTRTLCGIVREFVLMTQGVTYTEVTQSTGIANF